MSPPVMVALEPEEPLLLYVVATAEPIGMVLVAERPGPPQPEETKEVSARILGSGTSREP
jgi:hypothetical protein